MKRLGYGAALGAVSLCNCTALFDGTFPTDAGVLPELTTEAESEASAGAADAAKDAATCTGDLSNIGTNDFDISFTVTSVQGGLVALVSQRTNCGPSVFWDIRMKDGFILMEVDDVASYTAITSAGTQVDDGAAHHVSVRRSTETLTVYVNGIASGSMSAPQSIGQLAPVTIGTDPCVDSGTTAALVGTIATLCITSP
jgi:concanavalin A-like lectin/glucanase superfamily protein